ncbi:MAG: 16S rRNA (uracil(1498)-N(3))-methyltransferase [Gammaproteobacteria bacterium]|nr:16S rRNA (uracil(1498)-N(3))-methyltransferase [Gammaproteobacteria bacterium]
MRIGRVHVEEELEVGAEIALAQAQSHYLKHVLRLQPGAALVLFNGRDALDYRATLIANGKKLSAHIEAAIAVSTESELASEIVQGLGRADHMDWMIQKTTELGVSSITLFNAERTQTPLKPAQLQKKMNHWRGVAISACEQSGRAQLPEIKFHTNLTQALAASAAECKLLLEFEGVSLTSALDRPCTAVSILLGPEGGLNPAEIDLAKATGFEPVSLGPRVLRTETAATSALTIVQSLLGDMG